MNSCRSNLKLSDKDTTSEKKRQDAFQTGLNKVLFDHMQLLPMIRLIGFKWDGITMEFLNIQAYFSDISQSFSSFDCLLESN